MNRTSFQLIEGGRLPAEIRRSIHAQLFSLGQSPREVAMRHGLRDAKAVAVAIEVEKEDAARRERAAFSAGRRSLLTPPPVTMLRRAA